MEEKRPKRHAIAKSNLYLQKLRFVYFGSGYQILIYRYIVIAQ